MEQTLFRLLLTTKLKAQQNHCHGLLKNGLKALPNRCEQSKNGLKYHPNQLNIRLKTLSPTLLPQQKEEALSNLPIIGHVREIFMGLPSGEGFMEWT